jgi:hypothetical protein
MYEPHDRLQALQTYQTELDSAVHKLQFSLNAYKFDHYSTTFNRINMEYGGKNFLFKMNTKVILLSIFLSKF